MFSRLSSTRAFRLFVLALLLALTVPRMAQRGMFGDGLMYAVIARNMSIGAGSFWTPSYSPAMGAGWYEHPPLALGLEALAFRVLGDHLFVERLYSFATFSITALLIVAIWRRLHGPDDYDWLPLLFWVLPSIVTWAVINNMLENTQTVFTTAAVLLVLVAKSAASPGRAAMISALAGAASAAAVLAKGPVGLFPLAAPALTLLLPRRPALGRAVLMTAVAVCAVAACAAALALSDGARQALSEYFSAQVLASLRGQRETNADPLAAVRHLGLGIAARMLVVGAICWIVARPRGARLLTGTPAWFLVAVALSASLPIAISPKMVGHYFLPSVPFFALGIGALALPAVSVLASRAGRGTRGVLMTLAAVLVVAAVAVPLIAGPVEPRDVDMVRSLDAGRDGDASRLDDRHVQGGRLQLGIAQLREPVLQCRARRSRDAGQRLVPDTRRRMYRGAHLHHRCGRITPRAVRLPVSGATRSWAVRRTRGVLRGPAGACEDEFGGLRSPVRHAEAALGGPAVGAMPALQRKQHDPMPDRQVAQDAKLDRATGAESVATGERRAGNHRTFNFLNYE